MNDNLTLGVLFSNTISNYFSVDARFFRSFLPLLFKPGFLAKQFVGGKRLTYLHPAQMYLFISVVFFFLFSFIERDTTQYVDKTIKKGSEDVKNISTRISEGKTLDSIEIAKITKPLKDNQKTLKISDDNMRQIDSLSKLVQTKKSDVKDFKKDGGIIFNQKKIDSLISSGASDPVILKEMGMKEDQNWFARKFYAQLLKFYKTKSGGSVLQAFYDSIPIAMFVLLPIFAFILKIFFFRRGQYAHHLVFSFYFFSFLFMILSLDLMVNLFLYDIPDGLDWLILILAFFYLFFAIKRFYEQGWFVSFFKSSVVSFVFLLFVLPLAFILTAMTAFLMYWFAYYKQGFLIWAKFKFNERLKFFF